MPCCFLLEPNFPFIDGLGCLLFPRKTGQIWEDLCNYKEKEKSILHSTPEDFRHISTARSFPEAENASCHFPRKISASQHLTRPKMPVPPGYANKFVTDIPKLLDRTRGGEDYPHLHEVFTDRLPYRDAHLSRCWHRFPVSRKSDQMIQRAKQQEDRTDSPYYQLHYNIDGVKSNDRGAEDRITVINKICPLVKEDRFVIYGIVGSGSMHFPLFPY